MQPAHCPAADRSLPINQWVQRPAPLLLLPVLQAAAGTAAETAQAADGNAAGGSSRSRSGGRHRAEAQLAALAPQQGSSGRGLRADKRQAGFKQGGQWRSDCSASGGWKFAAPERQWQRAIGMSGSSASGSGRSTFSGEPAGRLPPGSQAAVPFLLFHQSAALHFHRSTLYFVSPFLLGWPAQRRRRTFGRAAGCADPRQSPPPPPCLSVNSSVQFRPAPSQAPHVVFGGPC